jgi:hypothetical protein
VCVVFVGVWGVCVVCGCVWVWWVGVRGVRVVCVGGVCGCECGGCECGGYGGCVWVCSLSHLTCKTHA